MKTTKRNNRELRSGVLPGDIYTCPIRIVLHESHSSTAEHPEYVTHQQNMQDGSFIWGHYFNGRGLEVDGFSTEQANWKAYGEALADYAQRCAGLHVDPMPAEGVQEMPAGVARPDRMTTRPAELMAYPGEYEGAPEA